VETLLVPRTFKLGGRNWVVEYTDELEDALGLCKAHEARILLASGMDKEATLHTFYHELFHAIFATLGREKLDSNEGLVDSCGNLLLQFLSTAKPGAPRPPA
jgi:hypothetical protein